MVYVNKLAPLAVVLAIAIYCMMTGMASTGSKSSAKKDSKLPVFTAELFAPELPPFSKRNPFYLPSEEPNAIARSGQQDKKTAETKPVDAKAAAANAVKEYFSGLSLNATYLLGEQRLAIINGKVYKQKETLNPHSPTTPPFVITQILPYEVVLECQGKMMHLRYSNVYAGTEMQKSVKLLDSPAKVDSPIETKKKSAAPKSRTGNKAKP